MRNVLLFVLFCFSTNSLFAESTVRYSNTSFETAISRDGTNFIDITATSSGDGSSSSSPVKINLPVENTANTLSSYFVLGDSSLYLPIISGTSTFTGFIRLNLLIDNNDSNVALYAAIKDPNSSNYFIFHKFTDSFADGYFSLSYANLCNGNFNTALNCADYDTEELNKTYTIYLFQSTDASIDATAGNTVDPASATGGLFVEITQTTKKPTVTPTFSELKKGDKTLTAVFTSSGISSSDIKTVIACVKESGSIAGTTVGAAGCYKGTTLYRDLETSAVSGEGTIRDLTNNVTYGVKVAIINKWDLATPLSSEIQGTPLEIQALLAKNQCYILSAGFQREHFVVDFYKAIRDRVLFKFNVGRKFIHWYYKTAPQYTGYIINSNALAFSIRMMAYAGMFIFILFPVVLLIGLGRKLVRAR